MTSQACRSAITAAASTVVAMTWVITPAKFLARTLPLDGFASGRSIPFKTPTLSLPSLADAVMLRDDDRSASLFTPDGAVRMPHINQ